MLTTFSREAIAAVCVAYGPQVGPLPAGVDGPQLMWGLSGNESSFGKNCTPRHEPAFDTGGELGDDPQMQALIKRFPAVPPSTQSPAACSYGPWQVMLCNARVGTVPEDFSDLATAATETVYALNNLLKRRKPQTLAEIGEVYNTGKIRPDAHYVAELQANYAVPMPAVQNPQGEDADATAE